jgi:ABC-type Co2+ transport system permease subunit
MTALMVVVMSVDLIPIGYELHGTVLAGIVTGPRISSIVALGFNVVRALIGDGAITNLGLNSVLTWCEMVGGFFAFRLLMPLVVSRRVALAGGLATVASLGVTTMIYLAVMVVSGDATYAAVLDRTDGAISDYGRLPHLGAESFVAFTLVTGAIGWTIEGLATGVVLAFIARARPSLVRAMQIDSVRTRRHQEPVLDVKAVDDVRR